MSKPGTGAGDRAIVRIEGATKRFGSTVAVDDVGLDIETNAFFALLGPSGCGKTTLLRALAGFEPLSSGRILIDGEDVSRTPPHRRPVNMVFQNYAVFPHMTVAENVGYGLKVVGTAADAIRARVEEALEMVRMAGFGPRRPEQLSGGQRQRVALARALIKRPKVLLLDEPLSALDKKLREEMQLELVRLRHEVGITFVMVTHDQEEALSVADRIAVMDQGRILQIASPEDLYETPNCRAVARFIGTMNLFEARVAGPMNGRLRVEADGLGVFDVEAGDVEAQGAHHGNPGRNQAPDIAVAVRPERIDLIPGPPPAGRVGAEGRIAQIAYFGDTSHVFVETASGLRITAHRAHGKRGDARSLRVGDTCFAVFDPSDAVLLPE